jgi:hypothetical protein
MPVFVETLVGLLRKRFPAEVTFVIVFPFEEIVGVSVRYTVDDSPEILNPVDLILSPVGLTWN